ncbi:UNVERIFIED_ORG: hypothetical protein GCAPEGMB_00422 [Vibrio phage V07]
MILANIRKYLMVGLALCAALTLIYAAVTHSRLKSAKLVINSLNGEIEMLHNAAQVNETTIAILRENDKVNREYRARVKAKFTELEQNHEMQLRKAKTFIPESDRACLNRVHPVEYGRMFQRENGGGNTDGTSETGQ